MGPRERLFDKGKQSLSDAELLAILLRTGSKIPNAANGLSVLVLAEEILARFGNLKEVLSASPEQLREVKGLGQAKIATLIATQEVSTRLLSNTYLEPTHVCDGKSAYHLFSDIANEEQEVLKAAFLTSQNQVIRRQEIFRGTVNSTVANPREIIREALRTNAVKIIVAHNHPSQVPEPSQQDIAFTDQLQKAAAMMGVPLIDHLIVCRAGRYFSFAEQRLIL